MYRHTGPSDRFPGERENQPEAMYVSGAGRGRQDVGHGIRTANPQNHGTDSGESLAIFALVFPTCNDSALSWP